jgi:enoyl-CoA hydratase/carnithine racemase
MRPYERIHVERKGARTKISLAYTKRRNAIGPQMTSELLSALEEARADDAVRVIVITGEGDVFSAGGDFAHLPVGGESPPSLPAREATPPSKGDYADLLLTLIRFDKPVIARVNGHAFGRGLGLAACCTFSVALKTVQFGLLEIQAGLFPMMVMSLLQRSVPRPKLLEMMLLGRKLDAADAERFGVITHVAEPGELDDAVDEIEDRLLRKSPLIIRLGLRAFAEQADLAIGDALPLMRVRFAECLATEDAGEGLAAFLEKRDPVWKGR